MRGRRDRAGLAAFRAREHEISWVGEGYAEWDLRLVTVDRRFEAKVVVEVASADEVRGVPRRMAR